MKIKKRKQIPFDFVIEELGKRVTEIKPMFGCHALYSGSKILVILRQKENETKDNGVWIATTLEHHPSLLNDFPIMRSISVLGEKPTNWQNLPENHPDFESSVFRLCELIKNRDPRIGKIPASKLGSKKRQKKSAR